MKKMLLKTSVSTITLCSMLLFAMLVIKPTTANSQKPPPAQGKTVSTPDNTLICDCTATSAFNCKCILGEEEENQ